MHRKEHDGPRLNLFFTAKKWAGEPRIMEPDICDNIGFFDIKNLPKNITPYVKQSIECMLQKIPYSEYGW